MALQPETCFVMGGQFAELAALPFAFANEGGRGGKPDLAGASALIMVWLLLDDRCYTEWRVIVVSSQDGVGRGDLMGCSKNRGTQRERRDTVSRNATQRNGSEANE